MSAGDVVVAVVADDYDGNNENYAWSSTPAETWVEGPPNGGAAGGGSFVQAAHTVLSANRTGFTVTLNRLYGGNSVFNVLAAAFTGTDGVGASVSSADFATGAAALTFDTLHDNSAIVYIVADQATVDGTSRVHRTVNGYTPSAGNGLELRYYADTRGWYAVYIAVIPDAGPAGAKTVGMTAPTGQRYSMAAVEVRGTAAAPAYSASVGVSGAGSLTVAGVPGGSRAVDLSGAGSLTSPGQVGVVSTVAFAGSGALAAGATASAGASAGVSGAGVLAASGVSGLTASPVFAGSGALSGVVLESGAASPVLAGTGALAATAGVAVDGQAWFAGAGTLSATTASPYDGAPVCSPVLTLTTPPPLLTLTTPNPSLELICPS